MKNHIRFSSVGVLAVMMAFLGNAFAADVFVPSAASVQAAAKKAGWIAGETSVSRLPREQIRRMLGVQNPPDMMGQFAVREDAKLFAQKPKTAIDWRNKNGVNYVSPIMNQGNCGSCVAFATAATLETQVNVTSGIPNLNPSFSKQALFVCGGGACEFGWQPELAAKYLQNTGVPDEAC
ncbi:MAG: C1 family peptidase, partial [Bdellovibrionota bacterium]